MTIAKEGKDLKQCSMGLKKKVEITVLAAFLLGLVFTLWGLNKSDAFLTGSFLGGLLITGVILWGLLVAVLLRAKGLDGFLMVFGAVAIFLFVWGGATTVNGLVSFSPIAQHEARVVSKTTSIYKYGPTKYFVLLSFEDMRDFRYRLKVREADWQMLVPGDRCLLQTRKGLLGGERIVSEQCWPSGQGSSNR